ncbi:MAG: MFS transporter [Sphingomonas sp.]
MREVNLEEVLGDQKLGRAHIGVLVLCTLVMLIDGFDVFLIGKLAPAISADFGEPTSAMSLVFVLQQAGLAAGAFLVGPLADRFGRRSMLLVCTMLFSVLTLATLLATTITEFAIYRAFAGFFLSGVLPNVIALLSEVAPRRARATFITIAFCGFAGGGVVASAFTAAMLETYGWRAGFWIGGLFPLVLLPVMIWYLQESVQFRAGRDGRDPRIAASLRRIAPGFVARDDDCFIATANRPATRSIWNLLDIFRGRLALATVLLWLSYFFALGNAALHASWIATFFNELGGVSLKDFALVSIVSFVGSLIGMLSVGFLMDRFGHRRVLPLIFVLNGALVFLLGYIPFGTATFVIVMLMWYFFQSGSQAGLNAFAAVYYPPHVRSTGVGWAFGTGRIGGVIAPLLGGVALSSGLSLQHVLALLALPPLVVGFFIYLLCLLRPVEAQT